MRRGRRRSRRSACRPAVNPVRAGLVACTGNTGCSSPPPTPSSTPKTSPMVRSARRLDGPVNIHLTGCHHSCAQHYIGDIGLIACRSPTTTTPTRSRAITSWSAAASAPSRPRPRDLSRRQGRGRARARRAHAQGLSRASASRDETFLTFSRRHEVEALKRCSRRRLTMSKNVADRRRRSDLVPETAPFTEEQRAWLNGFFAGLFSWRHGLTRAHRLSCRGLMPASGRRGRRGRRRRPGTTRPCRSPSACSSPKASRCRKLMAAMAQQDCGHAATTVQTYSGAIVPGDEKQLNLCVPGGKETAPHAQDASSRNYAAAPSRRAAARAGRRRPTPRRCAAPGPRATSRRSGLPARAPG